MQKTIIIGCPGSGKTTFAKKLSQLTNLPLIHLDAIWHKPDRTHISREEFDEILSKILSKKQWIIDGNYNRTMEMRMKYCDTIILFELDSETCLQGATERLSVQRDDMPWIDSKLDIRLQQEIEEFSEKVLPDIYALINKYGANKEVIVFTSRKQADDYLSQLTK